jgi:hypothetical protein
MLNHKNRKISMSLIKKIRYTTVTRLVKLTNESFKELNGGRHMTINGK